MISKPERRVLRYFKQFLMPPGQMLCISGPEFKKMKPALDELLRKGFLIEEQFKGGYSLTQSGFDAMQEVAATAGAK